MSIRQFANQRPILTASLCAGLQFALTILILKAGFSLVPPEAYGKVKLVAFASTLLLPLLLTQVFGLWRQVGFGLDKNKPTLFIFACLLPALAFLSMGVHQNPRGTIGSDLVMQFLNAFGEELLFRGVIFVILLSLPQWKAIVINGLLFGSMHLIHGYMDGNWSAAFMWAFLSAMAGMMFAAARYRGGLWLLVALHMIVNLASMYSNVEFAGGPAAAETAKWVAKALELGLAMYVIGKSLRRPTAATAVA
jgi:membrane protease YdiL (CAAX protease family)